MKIGGKTYRTIWFENNIVKIIDQTKLPHQFVIKDLKTVKDSINAIKTMEVRGAPLIGATAAYGLVLSILEKNDLSFLKRSSEELIQARPTAINLKWAVDRMMKKLSGINSNENFKIFLLFTPDNFFIILSTAHFKFIAVGLEFINSSLDLFKKDKSFFSIIDKTNP